MKRKSKKTLPWHRIKALIVDCDGILTDTRIFYAGPAATGAAESAVSAEWRRFFSVRDGWGIRALLEAGVLFSVITASKSEDIRARMRGLKVDLWYEGALDKVPCWEDFLNRHKLRPEEVAYMGDDVGDVPLMKKAGLSASVSDALPEVLALADYVAQRPAGLGAVREVCDLILAHRADNGRKDDPNERRVFTS
jgi:3-deoxy-D-manno-octulosonate 8-phosphate phosphatase (KDO 8-P phosphatase)